MSHCKNVRNVNHVNIDVGNLEATKQRNHNNMFSVEEGDENIYFRPSDVCIELGNVQLSSFNVAVKWIL